MSASRRAWSGFQGRSFLHGFIFRFPGTVLLWLCLMASQPAFAQTQRLLGLDISAWQLNISQTTWNNIRTNENRQFVFLRSSRGGTTGYYNQNDSDNSDGLNTLSQRYDDPYFVQNVNRATAAGMYVGAYHFSRPDIIATTTNAAGIANTGTNEADHFIEMAGAWMRPGYLLPVHDLEAGDGIRTDNEMAQFTIDFSDRLYMRMGIRPPVYINGNYAAFVIGGASASLRNQIAQPSTVTPDLAAPAAPKIWSARWPNQADPNAIDVQNTEPKDTYSQIYGPWDDYGTEHPWTFWQYASTGRLQSFNNGGSNLDFDAIRGGLEFLKDQLVPALWMSDSSGDWSTLTNWNSGQTPVAPVTGSGQVIPVGTQTLPTPRLPGTVGSGPTSGQHDTVILQRPNASITVTLSSGTHNIRKLYVREALNITGGALTVNYAPSPDSTTNGAQFSGPVTMDGGSFSVHTLQVDAAQTFSLGNFGTLTFNTIKLMPGAIPAKILLTGNYMTVNPLSNNITAVIANGAGAGSSGFVDLGGAVHTIFIGNGTADVDVSINVPISNGGLAMSAAGTLRVTAANNYTGGTSIFDGRLLVNNTNGSGTGSGGVNVNGGILGGTGTIAGVVAVSGTIEPGASAIGTLTLNSAPVLSVSAKTTMEIDRNGGSSLADKIVLTSGTLNYAGTLMVSNLGAALLGGEVFTLFNAPAYSGAFTNAYLPSLSAGLNWYLGDLIVNGSIKVNRAPIAGGVSFANDAPEMMQIPLANLLAAATDADGDILTVSGVQLTSTNGVSLSTNAGFILYSNYVSKADQINYTLSDGRGGSVAGTIQIKPSLEGRFASLPQPVGNAMTFQFVGSPGWIYYLERSTNLPDWVTIWTNTAPVGGLFNYSDAFSDLAAQPPAAFYRLRWSPQ
ncbi:MAG: GH25 family lysozyme [Verrucomicrobiota bacterium]